MLGLTGGEVSVLISCAFQFDSGIKHNLGNSDRGVCPENPPGSILTENSVQGSPEPKMAAPDLPGSQVVGAPHKRPKFLPAFENLTRLLSGLTFSLFERFCLLD